VRPERRRQFHRDLVGSVQDAFDLLRSCLNEGAPDLREQVLLAFAAWMRLSYGYVWSFKKSISAVYLPVFAVLLLASDSG
jgi:hypothetical protein